VNNNAGQGVIGTANEDGTNPQRTWISGLFGAQGLTTDGTYLYWSNGPDQIGRVSISGAGLDPGYITSARVGTKSGSAQSTPVPIAVGSGGIYFANLYDGYIGLVPNAKGAAANNHFLTILGSATGLAVDTLASPGPLPPPSIPDSDVLRADVHRIGLAKGPERSLLAKVDAFGHAVDVGDRATACDTLTAYANQVQALAGKKIPDAPAEGLLADIGAFRSTLGCTAD
jgi:hypothetical protein